MMKTLLSLFSIATVMVLALIGVNIFSSEPSMAQSKEFEKTKNPSTSNEANKSYKIDDRLQTNDQSKRSPQDKTGKAINFKTISWEELIPTDWDPSADFKSIDLGNFKDADPRAISALQKLRKAWDNAPTNPLLHEKNIKIPGFVVPLDVENGKVAAFLLVPYFGGCLHTPPPPANQIIEVQLEQAQMIKTMEPVWVSGQLESVRSQTEMGIAGYRLNAVKVTPYKESNRR